MSLFKFGFASSGLKRPPANVSNDEPSRSEKDAKYDVNVRQRSFQRHWQKTWPWLTYDEGLRLMKCSVCLKHPELTNQASALYRGTSNFKVEPIKAHAASKEHISCLKYKASELVDSISQSPLLQSLTRLNANQKQRLTYLFNTAYGVAKAGKPFSDFEMICSIQLKNNLNLGENYINAHGCTNFVGAIAKSLMNQNKKEINKANFVSVLSDGSTDSSILEQEIVYIRYVSPEKVPLTRLISIERLSSANADGIYNGISRALENLDLTFKQLQPDTECMTSTKPSLVSANFDGASVNLGTKSGVITKINADVPSAIGVHCVAHKLELAILDANKACAYMTKFEDTVKGVFGFYHYSPKRRRELKEIASVLEKDLAHFSSIKQVRWLASKERALVALEKNLESVNIHLQHDFQAGNRADDANRAKGYHKVITSVKFLSWLHFLLDYMPVVADLSRCFQFENLLVIELSEKLELCIARLHALKTIPGKHMKAFLQNYEPAKSEFRGIGVTGVAKDVEYENNTDITKMIDNTVTYINKRFGNLNKPPFEQLSVFNFHAWPLDPEALHLYGNEEISSLLTETVTGDYFSETEKNSIVDSEWLALKLYVRPMRVSSLMEVYTVVLRCDTFADSAIAKLVDYIFTISPSTSACERGFSMANHVKTQLRTSMTQENFANQLLIMSEGSELKDFDPEMSMSIWLLSTERARHIEHKCPGPRIINE